MEPVFATPIPAAGLDGGSTPASSSSSSSSSSSARSTNSADLITKKPTPCITGMVIDNGDCGHRFVGSWDTKNYAGAYDSDQSMADGRRWNDTSGRVDSRSIWKFTDVESGKYNVYVTWSVNANDKTSAATNAPFTVRDGLRRLRTIRANQQRGPGSSTMLGRQWYRLGTFNITKGALQVNLRNFANGTVYADAVKIEKVR